MRSRKKISLIFLLFFVVAALSACRTKKEPPSSAGPVGDLEEIGTLGRMTEEAGLIFLGNVDDLQNWKDRKDWFVVTLKPLKMLKGASPSPSVKVLDQRLFPKQEDPFVVGERVLVFLKELPHYTAWQDLIGKGVRYGVLGKDRGVIPEGAEEEEIARFVAEDLKLPPGSGAMKDFFLKTLEGSHSREVREDLSGEIFQRRFSLTTEDLQTLARLVPRPDFPGEGKIHIVQGIAALSGEESNPLLQNFFCLTPETVCLKAAEVLESRGAKIPISEYAAALEKASPDLETGLFAILGRHHRTDALSLFEKYLAEEKDEKRAGSILEALGDLGGVQAEELVLRYADDPRYYVRIGVVNSLGSLKSEKGIGVLEKALKTRDPSMIALAAQSLQKIGTPEALKTLSKYYEKGHHGHWEPTEGPQHFMPPGSP